MDLPPDLVLIHQPVRLRIMGLLYRHRDVRFSTAREALDLTDGNLASHAARLAEAGYIESRKVLTQDGFELRYRITRSGHDAFRRYLSVLRHYLDDLAAPDPPPPAPQRDPSGTIHPT